MAATYCRETEKRWMEKGKLLTSVRLPKQT